MNQQKQRSIIYLQVSVSRKAIAEQEGKRQEEQEEGRGEAGAAVGTVVKADNTLSMFYEYKK